MDEFLDKIAEILEIDAGKLSMEFDFRSLPDWGSLMGFSILIMLNDDYGVKVSADEFMRLKSIGEIYAKIK